MIFLSLPTEHILQGQIIKKNKLTSVTERDKSNRKIKRKCTACYAEAAKKGRAEKFVKLVSTRCEC